MFGRLFSFGIGVYVGVYIAQNYEIQKLDDPQKIFEKIKTLVEETMTSDPKKK